MMRRPQFSLRAVGAAIVAVALACAALTYASPVWATLTFTGTIGSLLLALPAIVYRIGRERAFWVGFALLGWSYLILVFGPWFQANIRRHLATQQALEFLLPKMQRTETVSLGDGLGEESYGGFLEAAEAEYGVEYGAGEFPGEAMGEIPGIRSPGTVLPGAAPGTATRIVGPQRSHFERVGHSLWALLLAMCGGWIARRLYLTGRVESGEA